MGLKTYIRNFLLTILPERVYIFIRYFISHGRFVNLKNPKSFTEKIQYRKLKQNPHRFSKFVDKFTVRKIVEERIGSEYLIPLFFCTDKLASSTFDSLPVSFVLKTTHGGGGKAVLLVESKADLDIKSTIKQFNLLVNMKMGRYIHEYFYDIEKPNIIAEKLMLSNSGDTPLDFKFHVFNNEIHFIQVDKRIKEKHYMNLYDDNFKILDFKLNSKLKNIQDEVCIPNCFDEMKTLAIELSKGFSYVRVDLYYIDSAIYFGELTFCPSSGWSRISPVEWDFKLGSLWNVKDE
ncbi:MAG: ATP-grasp fold amidoligase family protein [Pseudoalteromonas sp.]